MGLQIWIPLTLSCPEASGVPAISKIYISKKIISILKMFFIIWKITIIFCIYKYFKFFSWITID